jgi:hypothetical protein
VRRAGFNWREEPRIQCVGEARRGDRAKENNSGYGGECERGRKSNRWAECERGRKSNRRAEREGEMFERLERRCDAKGVRSRVVNRNVQCKNKIITGERGESEKLYLRR